MGLRLYTYETIPKHWSDNFILDGGAWELSIERIKVSETYNPDREKCIRKGEYAEEKCKFCNSCDWTNFSKISFEDFIKSDSKALSDNSNLFTSFCKNEQCQQHCSECTIECLSENEHRDFIWYNLI